MFSLKLNKYESFSPTVGRGSETQLQVGENLLLMLRFKG